MSFRTGTKSWEGARGCGGCDAAEESHLHCDGPLKGERVAFTQAAYPNRDHPIEGTGYVRIHWHYEGCMIDIEDEQGERRSLCPGLGDHVRVIGRPCLAARER